LGRRSFNEAGSTIEVLDAVDQVRFRFGYDEEERPIEVADGNGQPIAGYYHDPFGRRLWKTLEPGAAGHGGGASTETVVLVYSDEGYAAEFRLPGTPNTAPTQGPTSFDSQWIYAPEELWSAEPIAIRAAQGWRYPQSNHLGTPQLVIDGEGTVGTTLRANAFGETRLQGGELLNRFPGQLHDPETGLSYNYFRVYEPATGRYTQSDPIGLRGGLNTYGYALQNPLTHVDPDGLLVRWSVTTGQFGAAWVLGGVIVPFQAVSECKCGRRVYIEGYASFLVGGAAAKFGASVGESEFEQHAACPTEGAADGLAVIVNGGVSVGAGGGCGILILGELGSVGCDAYLGNVDAGVVGGAGASYAYAKRTTCCSE